MKSINKQTVLVLLLALSVLAAGTSVAEEKGEYVCPPCDCLQDDKVHDAPGPCPGCGMPLVQKKEIRNVAILVFDGVQIIDFTGPYEVFGQGPFNVYTVSRTGEALSTAMSMSMTPTHSFESSPRPDILIVPGGHVHDEQKNAETIGWIRKSAAGAEHVMSVCNGAFLLAQAGLLDGKKATTFYGLIDELQEFRPQVEVVRDQRFVDNGKVITSAGLSSGIDASLYLVSKILGMGRAQGLALHLEYQWDPESDFARASLADRLLPPMGKPEGTRVTMESTVGDQDRWEVRYRVEDVASAQQLTGHVNAELAKQERWSRVLATGGADESRSRWTFTDDQEGHWSGSSQVEPVPGSPDVYLVTLTIGRSEKTAQAASR